MKDAQPNENSLKLNAADDHHQYVAVSRSPSGLPRVFVGAFTPLGLPGLAKTLFMVDMNLSTARSYATAILEACAMVDADVEESEQSTKH